MCNFTNVSTNCYAYWKIYKIVTFEKWKCYVCWKIHKFCTFVEQRFLHLKYPKNATF